MLAAFGLLIAGLLALAVYGVVQVVKQRVYAHGIPALIWRYLSGMPHHGNHLTDAGWSRPGTRALTPTGHVSGFWYLPRRARALRRSGRAFALVMTGYGMLFARTATEITLDVAAQLALVYGIWRGRRALLARKHHLTWVHPAHITAAPLVGIPLTADPGDWLTIEPDRSRVAAILPPEYNPDDKQRQRLVQTLSTKTGLESPDVKWQLAGPRPTLELTQSQPPPTLVKLADVRAAIEAAKDDELVWGVGKRARVVKSSLSGDSPHLGLSMGSGAGKSVTSRAGLAQMLFKGAIGMILDCKMISHQWARGLPNVVIYRRPAEIHGALLWLDAELARRNEVALAGSDDDGRVHANVGPRIVIVFEEMNAAIALLRSYWREVRDRDDPARSPALTALDNVSFMGRQVRANIIYIGQRLSDKATGGGGDARENIGVIAFARYRPSTWKMLAPDFPMPPKNNAPGRLQVVSDVVQETQGILMTAAEARELATSGVVSPLPAGMPGAPRETREAVPVPALRIAPEQGSDIVSPPPGPLAVSAGVTLREAHEAGVFGRMTLAGVRTARHRDEAFPAAAGQRGTAEEYDPDELAAWAASRNRARRLAG